MTLFDDAESGRPDPAPDRPAPDRPAPPAVRLRMTVAYDGRGFHGFAVQPGQVTVAGRLTSAIERVLRLASPPVLACAGRTDAGVHAWGQSIHVDVPLDGTAIDLDDLHRRLVKLLAPAIVVRTVSLAPEGWDARLSARWRSYRYTVLNRALPDPFLHGQVWLVSSPLDLRAMQLACDPLIGEHDFSSFCRKPPPGPGGEEPSLVRRVLEAAWCTSGADVFRFDITATAFCHQMVRSIVGTMVDIGVGKRRAGEVATILRARDRSAAGTVAPPEGLCLWEVGYPPES